MAFFKKRLVGGASRPPAWTPTVNLATARPAVFALANAPALDDGRMRSAIARFVGLSERPPLERAIHLIQDEPDVLQRPWIWLEAVMRQAGASGDHHLAAAALYWACYWTSDLVPRNNLASFMELELDPIVGPRKAELLSLGVAAARQLPDDFVVVGDQTGQITAGLLADTAGRLLGV